MLKCSETFFDILRKLYLYINIVRHNTQEVQYISVFILLVFCCKALNSFLSKNPLTARQSFDFSPRTQLCNDCFGIRLFELQFSEGRQQIRMVAADNNLETIVPPLRCIIGAKDIVWGGLIVILQFWSVSEEQQQLVSLYGVYH